MIKKNLFTRTTGCNSTGLQPLRAFQGHHFQHYSECQQLYHCHSGHLPWHQITITLKDDTSFTIKSGVTFTVERGHFLDLGVLPSQPFDTSANREIDFGGMAGHPEPGLFWHGKAVVPCGYQGLLLEK